MQRKTEHMQEEDTTSSQAETLRRTPPLNNPYTLISDFTPCYQYVFVVKATGVVAGSCVQPY